MNYRQFKNSVLHLPIIASRDILARGVDRQALRNQLNRWQSRGLIIKLKRGVYILNPNDRKVNPGRQFIANQLYGPSYISLEYALASYSIIPERVTVVTSVTTRKTMRFENALGRFVYQHIKPEAFRGFTGVKDESGLTYFVAEPEKAIVDFLYLNLKKFDPKHKEVFTDSYRFQNVEGLRRRRITEMARSFGNDKLAEVARSFCKFIEEELR